MEAKIVNLQTLFEPEVSYRIPQFQRPYAWRETAQWKPLWEDVCTVAGRLLNRKAGDKIRPHFMGAIVLQHQTSKTGEVTKRLVVDGQQRLTTLQLLIKAIEQEFQGQDDIVRADRLQKLVTNQESYWGSDSHNQPKIRQSNLSDQAAFQAAIRSHHGSGQSQSWAISQAYRCFQVLVEDWFKSKLEDRTSRADALEEAITKYLQIAVIDLDEDETPHIVFETLNARGEPLQQSDLIKNTVMYEADVIDDVQKARELWGMFEDKWWREDTGERLKRGHIDRFLNYWMVMRTRKDVTADRLASEFRNYIERQNKVGERAPIEIVAADIRKAGIIYKNLEEIEITEIKLFLERMKVMGVGVVMPLLIWLYTSKVVPEQRMRSIKALESYLVRQMLCGFKAQGLNKFFNSLLGKLDKNSTAPVDSIIIEHLTFHDDSNRVWSNDRMLWDNLINNPMRGTVSRKKMILEAVETGLRSERSEDLVETKKLTVEHIMPKNWGKNWPLLADISDGIASEKRGKMIETIGNLTLTTNKLNASLSDGPWDEKRRTLDQHSTLFLNKTLLDDAPDFWDEAAIEERSNDLAQIVMQIWPAAETFIAISA